MVISQKEQRNQFFVCFFDTVDIFVWGLEVNGFFPLYFIITMIFRTKFWKIPICPSSAARGCAICGALLGSKATMGPRADCVQLDHSPQGGSLSYDSWDFAPPGTLLSCFRLTVPEQLARGSPLGSFPPRLS